MNAYQDNGSWRTLLALGLASALAACSSSSPPVADSGSAGADGGSAGTDGGSAVADGDDALSCGAWGGMFPGAKCADTFDAQQASQLPLPNTMPYVASGACGGYLVWINTGMLYTLACIYDPTTKMFVGGRYGDDTVDTCTGAGAHLPPLCFTKDPYPAPTR